MIIRWPSTLPSVAIGQVVVPNLDAQERVQIWSPVLITTLVSSTGAKQFHTLGIPL
jgi:hypothetical protein